jgi:hypothetical protein
VVQALKKEVNIFAEYTGLYGFIAKSGYQAVFPDQNQGQQVSFQGSRQMDSFSRRYYERELGAGIGPNPSFTEHFGYTEPFRRFVQREAFTPQANEIPNTMPRLGVSVLPEPKTPRAGARRAGHHALLAADTHCRVREAVPQIPHLPGLACPSHLLTQ